MSFVVFALIFAFILWQRLGKGRRRRNDVQSDVGRPLSASADDGQVEDIGADVAGMVSDFLGQKGQDLIGQAVSRAIHDSKVGTGVGRGSTEAIEPSKKAVPSTRTASQARDKRRVRYLLDGDGGYRQRTDRTARLQQSFRGKGLCSPR